MFRSIFCLFAFITAHLQGETVHLQGETIHLQGETIHLNDETPSVGTAHHSTGGVKLHCYRHGVTQANLDHVFQGGESRTRFPLSPGGMQSAWEFNPRSKHTVDRIVCSDTLRAKQTALLLFHKRGSIEETLLQSTEDVGIDIEPDITEVYAGSMSGKSKKDPDVTKAYGEFKRRDSAFAGFPNGEDLHTFNRRVLGGFRKIIESSKPGSHVHVISHNGPLSELLAFLGHPLRGVDNLEELYLSEEDCRRIMDHGRA